MFPTQSRLLVGVYQLDTEEAVEANGWRARVESHWTSNIFADVAVNQDPYFGTTFTFAIGLNWQPESYWPRLPPIGSFRHGPSRHITQQAADRLAESTHRLPNIVVRRGETIAEKPGGGPLTFRHVDSNAAAGGDGTIENPYRTLEAALAEAKNGNADVVYTPHGGSYDPPGVLEIPNSAQLLSNAPLQTVPTAIGSVDLPGSGASPDLALAPEIRGSVPRPDSTTPPGPGGRP
jgi:hypothetical protein